MSGADGLWRRERLLALSWQTFGLALERLQANIETSSFKPDLLVGVCRGGLPLLTYFANAWGTGDVACLSVTRNLEAGAFSERKSAHLNWLAPETGFAGRTVLLLDDIAGDGGTLSLARNILLEKGAREVRSAVLVRNARCAEQSEFFVFSVDDWVVFPWEPSPSLAGALAVEELTLSGNGLHAGVQAER